MQSRERRYELPGVEDLTKEQEAVRALPRKGRHLVVGGPGTGKTVVCLLRARSHAQKGDEYQFLVWNHLLLQASQALFGHELRATTWRSWFGKLFWQLFKEKMPKPDFDETGWQIDWLAVTSAIEDLPVEDWPVPSRLVIDEGQDMPPSFYDSLLQLGFEDIFVAADQNQQIKAENSSVAEIRSSLALDAEDVTNLTCNHRNSRRIAQLARKFYTCDPASPRPELPPQRGSVRTPRLNFVNSGHMRKIGDRILKHWDQDPRRLIGVIAPNDDVRQRYFEAVKESSSGIQLDNGRPTIETFYGKHKPKVRFDRGGIVVINAQACKGLEFDTVVLADIDEHWVNAADPDRTKKLFYVMVSRARDRVVMFMKRNGNPAVEKLLPRDEKILRRNPPQGPDLGA